MKRYSRHWLAFLLASVAAVNASGRTHKPLEYVIMDGSCDGSTVSLTVEFGSIPSELHSIQILRKTPLDCRGPNEVISEILVPSEGQILYEFEDSPPKAHTAYSYELTGYTELGDPYNLFQFNTAVVFTLIPCGHAIIGRGQLYAGPQGFAWFQPCESTCFSRGYVGDSRAISRYYGTGTTVDLYGTTSCAEGDSHGCYLYADIAIPATCEIVPTSTTTWGVLKSRY